MDPATQALTNGLYAVPIFIGSSFTILACAVIIASYRSYEELRRHPNGLVIYRSYFDAVFAIVVMVESAFRVSGHGSDWVNCKGFSFFVEFSLLASEICFSMLSIDLFTALRNPFVNYKSNMRKYIACTLILSASLAGILIGAGPQIYGMTKYGICWVEPAATAVNGYLWAFFYAYLVSLYIFAFSVLIYARRRLLRGLRDTYEARMTSFRHGVAYVFGYTLYWLIVAIVYWAQLDIATAPSTSPAAWIFCLFFTSRGVATMSIWLHNHNLKDVAKSEAAFRIKTGVKIGKVNRQLQPHLNLALRKEILHYTTLAIRLSVVQTVGEDKILAVMQTMKHEIKMQRKERQGKNARRDMGVDGLFVGAGAGRDWDGRAAPTQRKQKILSGRELDRKPVVNAGSSLSAERPRYQREFHMAADDSPATRTSNIRGRVALASGAATVDEVSVPVSQQQGAATPSGAQGLGHDPEAVTSHASVYAPYNDRKPYVPDDSLSTNWKPLDIALYAPLFERGGLYDLGDLTVMVSKVGKPPSAASSKVLDGGGPGKSAVARSGAGVAAVSVDAGDPEAILTPTSAHEGVIRRPPLELHDLAPDVFARIRDLYGISPAQFLYSLSRTTKERFSEGASGAFMCFSHDMKFVIKTMEKDEADVLQRILPDYLHHLRSYRDTLIIKFYACMSLRLYRQTLYFVVMENIFPTKATIHERFDLKGSWVGRSASKGMPGTMAYCRYCNESFKVGAGSQYCAARPNRPHVANTVLKDNDLTYKLRLHADKAQRLGAQLRADAAFLSKMRVMDYSLLIGVHNRKFSIENANDQSEDKWQAVRNYYQQQQQQPLLHVPHANVVHELPNEDSPVRGWRKEAAPWSPVVVVPSQKRRAARNVSFAVGAPIPRADSGGTSTSTGDSDNMSSDEGSQDAAPTLPARPGPAAEASNSNGLLPSSMMNPLHGIRGGAIPPAVTALPRTDTYVPFFHADEGGIASAVIEGPGVFYMGIIDILQEWNWFKKLERWLKTTFMCLDRRGVSVIPPDEYAARFEKRVVGEIIERDTYTPGPSMPILSVANRVSAIPSQRHVSSMPIRM